VNKSTFAVSSVASLKNIIKNEQNITLIQTAQLIAISKVKSDFLVIPLRCRTRHLCKWGSFVVKMGNNLSI